MTKEQAREWFMAGFAESGEGWNGTYPLNYPGAWTPTEQALLDEAFENAWILREADEDHARRR
jgi:hypothetical protein